MSIKELIESAYQENPSKFERIFESLVSEKIQTALEYKRQEVVAEMFNIDLSEQELSEEEYIVIYEALKDLDEDVLNEVADMEIVEAAEFLDERFQKGVKLTPDTAGSSVRRGALSGAVKGAAAGGVAGGMAAGPVGAAAGAVAGAAGGAVVNAARHVVDHGINKGAKAVGRGVKRVAKTITGRK